MKKIIILFLISIISFSGVVRAEVETTENKAFMSPEEVREYMKYMDEPEEVQRAREAIFNGENKIVEQIDVSEYKDYFIDKKYSPNQKFRNADFNSNGKYRLYYNNSVSFEYINGNLLYIIYKIYKNHLPFIEYIYNINGSLKYVFCEIKGKGYVFDNNKTHLYTWYKYKLFDKNGNIILKNRPYRPYM